jgi:hypothetical protein
VATGWPKNENHFRLDPFFPLCSPPSPLPNNICPFNLGIGILSTLPHQECGGRGDAGGCGSVGGICSNGAPFSKNYDKNAHGWFILSHFLADASISSLILSTPNSNYKKTRQSNSAGRRRRRGRWRRWNGARARTATRRSTQRRRGEPMTTTGGGARWRRQRQRPRASRRRVSGGQGGGNDANTARAREKSTINL